MTVSPVLQTFGQPTDVCRKTIPLSATFSHDGNMKIGGVGIGDSIGFATGIITIRQPVVCCQKDFDTTAVQCCPWHVNFSLLF